MSNFKSELKGLNRFQPIPRDLIQDCGLSAQARFIYSYMAAKPEGWEFWQDVMCKEVGMSVATLRKYLHELRDAGWLEIGPQGEQRGGRFGAIQYTLKAICTVSENLPYGNNTVAQKLPYGKISDTQNLAHIDNIDSLQEIDTQKEKKSKSTRPPLILPFSTDKFIETWNALCEEKNWKGKTQKALQLTLNKLGRYHEDFAVELMEKTIENGWKGVVFSDTDAKFQEWQSARQQKIDNTVQRTTQPKKLDAKTQDIQERLKRMRKQAQRAQEAESYGDTD